MTKTADSRANDLKEHAVRFNLSNGRVGLLPDLVISETSRRCILGLFLLARFGTQGHFDLFGDGVDAVE